MALIVGTKHTAAVSGVTLVVLELQSQSLQCSILAANL